MSSFGKGSEDGKEETKHRKNQYPELYKVIGAPGTGKTTRVVGNPELPDVRSLVMENMDEYGLEDQLIVTYTNAATDEAAERLYKITDHYKYEIEDRVTTIHSQCASLIDFEWDNRVAWYHKKDFCHMYDLDWGGSDDEDDIMGQDKASGNALLDIYGWLQSNRCDLSEWRECPAEAPADVGDVQHHLELWEEFKKDRGLIGFGDMIIKVIEQGYAQLDEYGYGIPFPSEDTTTREMFEEARYDPARSPETLRGEGAFVDTKVMYVDEVQDLTPLMWEWYLMQCLVCEKVYIGGDDDQTIYGWQGASPAFMLDEDGDFEVLEKTYRIPANIWEKCNSCIQQVDKRQEKNVEPHGDGGEFVPLRAPSTRQIIDELEGDRCFALFRARYHIDEFREELHEKGIPYRNESTFDTWSATVEKVRNALAKIDFTGEPVKGEEIDALMDQLPGKFVGDMSQSSKTDEILSNMSGTPPEKVQSGLNLPTHSTAGEYIFEGYLEHAEELNYYEKEAIRGNLRNKNWDMDTERLILGTVHSAKGREAETVVLATDSTRTILEGMREDTRGDPSKTISDAERRVLYVGMSRASQKLVLAQGVVDPSSALEISEIVGDEYRADEWEVETQKQNHQYTQ